MTQSYIIDPFSRESAQEKHPWLRTRDLYMVLGDDLDSVTCAVLMHHLLGWKVAGFYVDYKQVWYPGGVDIEVLRDAVWLDLDISREQIKSIGHHILLSRPDDHLRCHRHSVNPNLLRGVTAKPGGFPAADHGEACRCGGRTFPHKYPLGTIHFLLWLYNVDLGSLSPDKVALLWLPDSSWISGQSHRYRKNMLDWVRNWIPHPALKASVDRIDGEDFERLMQDAVFAAIEEAGFSRGTGQVTSRHLRLGGYQCQLPNPNYGHVNIVALSALVASSFGWSAVEIPPPPYHLVEGSRNPEAYTLGEVRRRFGSLDGFITDQQVFSYVVPNAGKINYTVGISL